MPLPICCAISHPLIARLFLPEVALFVTYMWAKGYSVIELRLQIAFGCEIKLRTKMKTRRMLVELYEYFPNNTNNLEKSV